MTSLVALVLAGMYSGLKPIHKKNEALYAKKAILSAVSSQLPKKLEELSDEQVQEIFDNNIEQAAINMSGTKVDEAAIIAAGYKGGKAESIDMSKEVKKEEKDQLLPVFIYKNDKGEKSYIVNVRGKGLWDEIWGNIALTSDLTTIVGVSFDHKGETPGLGAEIKDNKGWYTQFIGKKIYDGDDLRPVFVRKGGAKDKVYEVDGISGATITADGVSEMLERGLTYYKPYFDKVKG